ncbi:MAG: ABC transporter ATP-binding protein [Actinomycetota bacterium]|nr:ABC transporter ATP-binding protein [Actinomycetota bacterium]
MRAEEVKCPAVWIGGVEKSYGRVTALSGLDLAIFPGETVALLGPNGAGKSTTIDLLLGLSRPDAGEVRVLGEAPAEMVAAGRVGGMLQTGQLIRHLRVRELVSMVASLYPRPRPVDEVLELTATASIAGRDTTKLSGGQTQRVRLALGLVGDPDLLVLDEPTAALDVEGRRELWAVLRAVSSSGTTVLFATHYLEEADEHADRVVLLAAGRVVADGTPNEVRGVVGGRRIRANLPGVDSDELAGLAGVAAVERRGDAVVLSCTGSDAALRLLLARYPTACDIEVTAARLEEAFVELTGAGAGAAGDPGARR